MTSQRITVAYIRKWAASQSITEADKRLLKTLRGRQVQDWFLTFYERPGSGMYSAKVWNY